jgi:predicted transcriptional regulator
MGKHRDSLRRIADILEAVNEHSSKTGIMDAANLNFSYVNSCLRIALSAGFLMVSDQRYEITEKGRRFLEKYRRLNVSFVEITTFLERLKEERKALENEMAGRKEGSVKGKEILGGDTAETPGRIVCSFGRIDATEFFEELTSLGFAAEAALEIVSWIDLIVKKDRFFFSGKKPSVIKACLASVGTVLLSEPNNMTRQRIRRFFKVDIRSIQHWIKEYRKLISEEKPELFK